MIITEFEYDIPIAWVDGDTQSYGVYVENDVDISALRKLNETVVDVSKLTTFFVCKNGKKHIEQLDDSWQKIECAFSDTLIKNGETWSIIDSKREAMSLSAAQARLNLSKAGLLLRIIDTINAMPDDCPLKIKWEYETVYRRLDPTLVDFCKQTLGMTDEQIDDLFLLTTED